LTPAAHKHRVSIGEEATLFAGWEHYWLFAAFGYL
jgi:hypothetical protein